jgi:hypothetical protein
MNFFGPINLQHRKLIAQNLEFKVFFGQIMKAQHPLGLRAINIFFDFSYSEAGWIIEVPCNYPEAQLTNEIYLENNHVIRNHTHFVNRIMNGYLSNSSPANVTVK